MKFLLILIFKLFLYLLPIFLIFCLFDFMGIKVLKAEQLIELETEHLTSIYKSEFMIVSHELTFILNNDIFIFRNLSHMRFLDEVILVLIRLYTPLRLLFIEFIIFFIQGFIIGRIIKNNLNFAYLTSRLYKLLIPFILKVEVLFLVLLTLVYFAATSNLIALTLFLIFVTKGLLFGIRL